MNYSAQYHVVPATFHVIARIFDFLWDSDIWTPYSAIVKQHCVTRNILNPKLYIPDIPGWGCLTLLNFRTTVYVFQQVLSVTVYLSLHMHYLLLRCQLKMPKGSVTNQDNNVRILTRSFLSFPKLAYRNVKQKQVCMHQFFKRRRFNRKCR